jgi:hypothetical protein
VTAMKKLLILTVTVISFMTIGLAQYGLFSPVKIFQENTGPFLMVYVEHTGSYNETLSVSKYIHRDLNNDISITFIKEFGLFNNDLQRLYNDKLNSISGCIINYQRNEKLVNIKKKYSVYTFPKSQSVIAEFPYNGTLSILIGFIKVYPKLRRTLTYLGFKNITIIEIYDSEAKKIRYIAPVNIKHKIFQTLLNSNQ